MANFNHGFSQWNVSLNGVELLDLAGGPDSIMFPKHTQSNNRASPGGNVVSADTSITGGPVTIKCEPGGRTDLYLAGISEQHNKNTWENNVRIEHNLRCHNETTGETVICSGGNLQESPAGVNIGSEPPDVMEYIIFFADISRTV